MKTKKCTNCNITKLKSDFYKNIKNKDGVNGWCKKCSMDYGKKYRQKIKDSPEFKLKEKYRKIKQNYGLDQKEYDQMVANGCYICGSHENLNIDHCHTTEKIRGILCKNCNLGLGKFKDNPQLLTNAILYLNQ